MKPLILLIPGTQAKEHRLLHGLVKAFCHYFGVDLFGDHILTDLKTYLQQNTSFEVLVFPWSQGISDIFSVKSAAQALAHIIKENKSRPEIVLFGKSLGGRVAELAAKYADYQPNISKLLYVATPHSAKHGDFPKTIERVNIYSSADNYVRFANIILYFNFTKTDLHGAQNIVIPNVRHSMFNKNIHVTWQNRKVVLFEVYKKIILK